MSEGNDSLGISRTTFVAGLVIAILVSTVISTIVITQTDLARGPQGSQGLQGETGPQGPQGSPGPPGTVPADVKALITVTFTSIWWGEDRHDVEGIIINFGTEMAYDVKIEFTWNLGEGKYVFKTIEVGNVWSHYIGEISETYYFEEQGTYSYEITWT